MYEYLSQWKWKLIRGYAKRTLSIAGGKSTTISLHREVSNPKKLDKVIFIDNNPLNCTLSNMMIGTQKNVAEHRMKRNESKSKFKGVCVNGNKYTASIKQNGKSFHIGTFQHEIQAAIAYNNEAKIRFGKFANLNKIDQ